MEPYWLSSDEAWQRYRAIEVELTSTVRNDWIILMVAGGRTMDSDSTVTVGIEISGTGEGSLLFTGESFESMIADTATGVIWSQENVTETTYTCFPGITGIRPIWVSGTIKVVVVI